MRKKYRSIIFLSIAAVLILSTAAIKYSRIFKQIPSKQSDGNTASSSETTELGMSGEEIVTKGCIVQNQGEELDFNGLTLRIDDSYLTRHNGGWKDLYDIELDENKNIVKNDYDHIYLCIKGVVSFNPNEDIIKGLDESDSVLPCITLFMTYSYLSDSPQDKWHPTEITSCSLISEDNVKKNDAEILINTKIPSTPTAFSMVFVISEGPDNANTKRLLWINPKGMHIDSQNPEDYAMIRLNPRYE